MNFYEIYEKFNKDNCINLFILNENEIYEYVPILPNSFFPQSRFSVDEED